MIKSQFYCFGCKESTEFETKEIMLSARLMKGDHVYLEGVPVDVHFSGDAGNKVTCGSIFVVVDSTYSVAFDSMYYYCVNIDDKKTLKEYGI